VTLKRVVREVLVLAAATIVLLALFVLVVYSTVAQLDAGEVLGVVPEFVLGFAGAALAVWVTLVALGAAVLRRRGSWWRIGAHSLSALVAGLANVVIVVALGEAQGAQGGIVGALGLLGSSVFVPLALLVTPVVVLLLDRGRRAAPAAGAITSDPADER
jgi:hypothetical protein